jgi:hypothetical protein
MRMGHIERDCGLTPPLLPHEGLSRFTAIQLYRIGAQPKISTEYRSKPSMRHYESPLILLTDESARPPMFIFAQPGTASLHERRASVEREATDMNGTILHPYRYRPSSACNHLNGLKDHDRLTGTRIHR